MRICTALFPLPFYSTFTDTGVERNFLVQHVYPACLQLCRSHGISFHAVDLRWGIRDEATDDHRTVEICMKEIDACKDMSLGPVFLHFSTNKVPMPLFGTHTTPVASGAELPMRSSAHCALARTRVSRFLFV